MLKALGEWLPGLFVIVSIFAVPLVVRRGARISYASAARVVAATFPVVVLLGASGTTIVAPLVWSEQLRMAAFFAALAALIYAIWCVLVIRRNRRALRVRGGSSAGDGVEAA